MSLVINQYRIPILIMEGEMVKDKEGMKFEKTVGPVEEDKIGETAKKVGTYNKAQETKIRQYTDGLFFMSFRMIQSLTEVQMEEQK